MAVDPRHCETRDCDGLAPPGLPPVLALENSTRKPGRPGVPKEIRSLIRTMSRENPLWGAPRIHGELLKLDIDVGETSVSKYMIRHRHPPSQTWRTFLDNHVKSMVSIDFFTVPTLRFQVLYVFVVLAHDRRRIVHFNVTAHPTPSGPANSSERPSRLTRFHVTCCAIATACSAAISPDTSRP